MYFLLVPVFQTFLLQKEIFWSVLRFANSFVSLNKSGQFSIIPKPKLRNFFDHLKVTGNPAGTEGRYNLPTRCPGPRADC